MGQVGSFLLRKANRFNVENRAHRVLERDKPTMAPRYPHSVNDMKRTLEGKLDFSSTPYFMMKYFSSYSGAEIFR